MHNAVTQLGDISDCGALLYQDITVKILIGRYIRLCCIGYNGKWPRISQLGNALYHAVLGLMGNNGMRNAFHYFALL